jgi:hypothetical protein
MHDGLSAQEPEWLRAESCAPAPVFVEIAGALPAVIEAELEADFQRQQEQVETEYVELQATLIGEIEKRGGGSDTK